MPMRGAPQIHISLSKQRDPARGSSHLGRAVCSEPSMQTGQVGWGAVSSTKGTKDIWDLLHYFSSVLGSTIAADSLSQQCRATAGPQVKSLGLTSQVPVPHRLHISRTHISFGPHAIHLIPSNSISILAFVCVCVCVRDTQQDP